MKKVLLVDDDANNRLTLSAALELDDAEVDVAASFQEARSRVERAGARYDLVLLDQHLGDGEGATLVPIVRAAMPGARVILISGSADRATLDAAGPDAIVVKGTAFADMRPILWPTKG